MADVATKLKAHPAQYSPEIISQLRQMIPEGTRIHDSNAGPGVRLGHLATELGCVFSGTEIEPPFIVDKRVKRGDATVLASYPTEPFWNVTSPAYPNGMSDSWLAKDGSVRRTYRYALKQILGIDRELHQNNQGRWGFRGTGSRSKKRQRYWKLARQMIECWTAAPCECVLLNLSDFKYKKKGEVLIEPVVAGWDALMIEHGWVQVRGVQVVTRRYKNGSDASRDERMPTEHIIEYRRAA